MTALQRKRFIFLLGNRYKNSEKIRITVRHYNNFEDNFNKAKDIIRQMYLEAKRAPLFHPRMKPRAKRKVLRSLYGPDCEERRKIFEEAKKEISHDFEQFKKFRASATKEDIAERKKQLVIKYISQFKDSQSSEEAKSAEQRNNFAEVKYLTREEVHKKLVEEKKLTEKAYNIFFKLR